MAGVDVTKGIHDPAFQALLRLLASGDIWVKLTVCRVSKTLPNDYSDVRPFHDALVRENPERLLWGSDFPFVRMEDRMPDLGRLIELFLDWTPAEACRQILVEIPPGCSASRKNSRFRQPDRDSASREPSGGSVHGGLYKRQIPVLLVYR